jgi:large subunit ribosomal protein L22
METRAKAKFLRVSPQKLRLVADVVRGKDINEALTTLKFMPKKGARVLSTLLYSAVKNAEEKQTIDVDTLYVKKIWIDEGPTLKRWMARAQGRANRINKRTSHASVVLDER